MLPCQEAQKRFDVFLDGETDGRTMRDLALHVTQCVSCEADLRLYERSHAAFVEFMNAEIDRIDVALLWQRIEPNLRAVPRSRVTQLSERLRNRSSWIAPTLAAAASFAAVVGLASLLRSPAPTETAVAQLPSNEAHIEALDASTSHVAVWSEPVERTTAIWFAGHEP